MHHECSLRSFPKFFIIPILQNIFFKVFCTRSLNNEMHFAPSCYGTLPLPLIIKQVLLLFQFRVKIFINSKKMLKIVY